MSIEKVIVIIISKVLSILIQALLLRVGWAD